MSGADSALALGTTVTVAGRTATIARRAGTDQRPLIRLEGIAAGEVAGETLFVDEPLGEDEYAATDLVGAEVVGIGRVERVVNGPSCDVLEVGDVLIPFVSDAIVALDLERRVIEVDREFLGLDP